MEKREKSEPLASVNEDPEVVVVPTKTAKFRTGSSAFTVEDEKPKSKEAKVPEDAAESINDGDSDSDSDDGESGKANSSNKSLSGSKAAGHLHKPRPNLTFETVSQYFALPIAVAAKELDVCVTVLKKTCRKFGVKRWPHRKLRALEVSMLKAEKRAELASGQQSSGSGSELNAIRQKRSQLADLLKANPGVLARGLDSSNRNSQVEDLLASVAKEAKGTQEGFKNVQQAPSGPAVVPFFPQAQPMGQASAQMPNLMPWGGWVPNMVVGSLATAHTQGTIPKHLHPGQWQQMQQFQQMQQAQQQMQQFQQMQQAQQQMQQVQQMQQMQHAQQQMQQMHYIQNMQNQGLALPTAVGHFMTPPSSLESGALQLNHASGSAVPGMVMMMDGGIGGLNVVPTSLPTTK